MQRLSPARVMRTYRFYAPVYDRVFGAVLEPGRRALGRAVGFCGFNLLVWWGLFYTRPEHAAIIMALQTPMAAIAVWLTQGKRPAPFTVGCVAAAIGGVVLVVTKGSLTGVFAGGSLLGDLLVFLGAVSCRKPTSARSCAGRCGTRRKLPRTPPPPRGARSPAA